MKHFEQRVAHRMHSINVSHQSHGYCFYCCCYPHQANPLKLAEGNQRNKPLVEKKSTEPPGPRKDSTTTLSRNHNPWKPVSLEADDVTRSDHPSLLTTSPAHITWVSRGLQPALWELQTQGKGYQASQGHKPAWRAGAVASHLELAAPSAHPTATMGNQICGEFGYPKSFRRAVFLPRSGWARGTPTQVPLAFAKRNSWENSAQPHCRLMVRPTVIAWWGGKHDGRLDC